MKKIKKGVTIGAIVLAMGVTSIVGFASSVDEGATQFKQERIEVKKDHLNAQVKAGTISQEKADEIMKAIEENRVDCDGTGSARIGQREGARFGSKGLGHGRGMGQGRNGNRLQDGTCLTPAN